MDISEILSVGLTAEDFDLLIRGIDSIQPADAAVELMMDAMTMKSLAGDRNKIARYEAEMKAKRNREQGEKDRKAEDIVVLKSKLIQLKRLLTTNAAVGATNDIIGGGKPQIIDNYQTGKKITNLTKITKIKFGNNMLVI